jgi:predicted lipoprotein with Yx(FWY)xxD motif
MRMLVLAAAVALVSLVPTVASGASQAASISVRATQYGRILVDGRGHALYAFTSDGIGRSRCSGACARAWPPFVVTGRVAAVTGARARLVGTIRRADGARQVTYAGRPLYFYVGDKRPGQVLCQNVSEFGGLWLVVRPTGRLVR